MKCNPLQHQFTVELFQRTAERCGIFSQYIIHNGVEHKVRAKMMQAAQAALQKQVKPDSDDPAVVFAHVVFDLIQEFNLTQASAVRCVDLARSLLFTNRRLVGN